eukprot:6182783-Pleurochrysis_carterae.AAC.1
MTSTYKYCAGILPYRYFNDELYFFLGKSKRTNQLCTFSGKNDAHETRPTITATREGYEETLGCMLDKATILDKVRRCDSRRVVYSETPRGMPCYTYLIEVPFKRHYVISFHLTRNFLNTLGIRSYALQEMTDVKWVCA